MESVDGCTRRNFSYWKKDPAGVPRLILTGVLDLEVLAELAATLGAVPLPSASTIDIDFGGVTFLDARTAVLFASYRAAARRLGKQVRMVNAAGMPLKVLTVLGVLPAEADSGADVFGRAHSAVARSRELIREAERLRETYERHGRG